MKTKKYAIRIARTVTQYLVLEVEALGVEQAEDFALQIAGDRDFHNGTTGEPEYNVDEISELAY